MRVSVSLLISDESQDEKKERNHDEKKDDVGGYYDPFLDHRMGHAW
jgi:hypothetical protein